MEERGNFTVELLWVIEPKWRTISCITIFFIPLIKKETDHRI